jgi:hypothetical protein
MEGHPVEGGLPEGEGRPKVRPRTVRIRRENHQKANPLKASPGKGLFLKVSLPRENQPTARRGKVSPEYLREIRP